MKTKLYTVLTVFGTLSAMTVFAFWMPDLIDKLNEEDMIYSIEQIEAKEKNDALRANKEELQKQIIEIDKQIESNSELWHELQGKREQIKNTIKMIETWELDQ